MLKGKKIKYHSMKTCAFPTHPTVRTQCRYYKSLSNALLDKFRCAKYKKCKMWLTKNKIMHNVAKYLLFYHQLNSNHVMNKCLLLNVFYNLPVSTIYKHCVFM